MAVVYSFFRRSVLFALSCLVTKSGKLTHDFTLGTVIPAMIIVLCACEIHSALLDYEEVNVWKAENGD